MQDEKARQIQLIEKQIKDKPTTNSLINENAELEKKIALLERDERELETNEFKMEQRKNEELKEKLAALELMKQPIEMF